MADAKQSTPKRKADAPVASNGASDHSASPAIKKVKTETPTAPTATATAVGAKTVPPAIKPPASPLKKKPASLSLGSGSAGARAAAAAQQEALARKKAAAAARAQMAPNTPTTTAAAVTASPARKPQTPASPARPARAASKLAAATISVVAAAESGDLKAPPPKPPGPAARPMALPLSGGGGGGGGGGVDRNDDICRTCHDGGELVLCESCPNSYHTECLFSASGWENDETSDDPFYCSTAGLECDAVDRAVYHHHRYTESDAHVHWDGPPIRRTASGNAYYQGFSIDRDVYRIGEFVVMPADDNDETRVMFAEVMNVWSDVYGRKWMLGRWYVRPEETATGRLAHHLPNELFQTNREDENFLGSVDGKVYIKSYADFKANPPRKDLAQFTFVVRQRYDEDTGQFHPLLASLKFPNRASVKLTAMDAAATAAALAKPVARKEPKPKLPKSPREKKPPRSKRSGSGLAAAMSDDDDTAGGGGGGGEDESGQLKVRAPFHVRRAPFTALDSAKLDPSIRSALAAASASHDKLAASKKSSGGGGGGGDVYSRAVASLQLSAVPASLPCRHTERRQVFNFLHDGIKKGGRSEFMFVCGMPGTGKTATVLQCITELWNMYESGELPPFQFVEINGMKLPDPQQTYTLLYKSIKPHLATTNISAKRATQELSLLFSRPNSKRAVTVVLLDEIDFMLTRKFDVLYNLFDWQKKPFARLVVLGISNTTNLKERLPDRVQSRMGDEKIIFQPYSIEQMTQILKARLKDLTIEIEPSTTATATATASGATDSKQQQNETKKTVRSVMDEFAINLIVRKTAGDSGDIRRALEIARAATEWCRSDVLKAAAAAAAGSAATGTGTGGGDGSGGGGEAARLMVTTRHVERALEQIQKRPHMALMRRCTKYEKIMLWAIYTECVQSNAVCVAFKPLADRSIRVCNRKSILPPTAHDLLQLVHRLGETHLVEVNASVDPLNPDITFRSEVDDIAFALKEHDIWKLITDTSA